MSLDAEPEPSLRDLKGRLETIESAWWLATTPSQRAQSNEDFKQLADEIKKKFGEQGKKVVEALVAKHIDLQRPRS